MDKNNTKLHKLKASLFQKLPTSATELIPSLAKHKSKYSMEINGGIHADLSNSSPSKPRAFLFENSIVDIREAPIFNRFYNLLPQDQSQVCNLSTQPNFYPLPFSAPHSKVSEPDILSKNKNKSFIEDDSSSIEELLNLANSVACNNEDSSTLEEKPVPPKCEDSPTPTRSESRVDLHNSREMNDHSKAGKPRNVVVTDTPEQRQENQICRYYQHGFCLRGEFCNYSHGSEKASISLTSPLQFGTLDDCTGQLYLMCLDQFGCRFLQKELDAKKSEITDKIFYEIIDYIVELMSDPFGNYLCQKLLELCDENQRFMILDSVAANLVDISTNIHGTRAVQKLIEVIETDLEFNIVRESLKDHIVWMIQDLNGNHVVQKCLQKMIPQQKNQFIYDSVAASCVEVTTHRHGCCVFQRCIDFGTYNQKLQLIETIKWHALSLIKDPFGNYAVQYIIELKIPNVPSELIKRFQGQIYFLAKQKFSSNVIEKCLKEGDSVCVKRVMSELLFDTNSALKTNTLSRNFLRKKAQEQLFDLLQDCFGNYVIQTCLSEGITKANREYTLMVELLSPFTHQLRNTPYGKKILYHFGFSENPLNNESSGNSRNHIWAPTKSIEGNRSERNPPERNEFKSSKDTRIFQKF